MTEQDAIDYLEYGNTLTRLPKRFHTKEFVLKSISERGISIALGTIHECGIKIDYDIALVRGLRVYKIYGYINSLQNLYVSYHRYLSDEEINKLKTTLELLTS